jgi:GTP-binding protein Era
VGKSTLVNRLTGHPVSIISSKPQTTRNRILGVCHGSGYQAVLVDTPGIHQARDLLNQRLVAYAQAGLRDADLVLVLVEPLSARFPAPGPDDTLVLSHVAAARAKALLVVNKADLAAEETVRDTLRVYGGLAEFVDQLAVSALDGRGVERLKAVLPGYLPEGPRYFEGGQWTDQPETLLLAELVRQEVFRLTEQEIPYSTAVQIEAIEERPTVRAVHARILVERDSQKGILIGKGGRMLRSIGQAARRRMEGLVGRQVFLDLRVAVLPDWSRDARRLTELGYPEE